MQSFDTSTRYNLMVQVHKMQSYATSTRCNLMVQVHKIQSCATNTILESARPALLFEALVLQRIKVLADLFFDQFC